MNRVFRTLSTTAAGLLACAIALPAAAQFAKPEDAIKYRKAGMTILAAHFGRVAGMANGKIAFDPKAAAEMDKFRASASKMQDEMVKLNVAAKGGNLDAIKAAVGETGKACKACHDNYRKE